MSTSLAPPPAARRTHDLGVRVLRLGLLGAAVAALVMVATPWANALFSWIVFGTADSWATTGDQGSYVAFAFAILGGGTLGWMVALWWIAGRVAAGEPGAWPALAASVAAWFLVDCTMSLARGYPVNLIVNVVFLVAAFAPGLWLTRPRRRRP